MERDPFPLLQTDSLAYAWVETEVGYRTSLSYTFRNETGGDVVLANCDGDLRPRLEVRRDGNWFFAWEPFGRSCISPPVVLAPGAVHVDSLTVVGALPGSNVLPAFVFPEVEGVYRLVWFRAYAEYDAGPPEVGSPLPLEQRISNAFVLHH
jgi:hypothetical protein